MRALIVDTTGTGVQGVFFICQHYVKTVITQKLERQERCGVLQLSSTDSNVV